MKTILLVDDSKTILMSMESVLKKAGFSVVTADGGHAALAKIKANLPDLMITDLNMPGMDGITLIKEVKNDISRYQYNNEDSYTFVYLSCAGYFDGILDLLCG